jgi:hypothetical protein
MATASPQTARASLGVRIAPSRVRKVARDAARDARRTSKAPRRARTGALDLRGASVVSGSGVAPHAKSVPPKTSGCSPKTGGSSRSLSGSPRRKEKRRRHAQGCFRSSDCACRNSQSCCASLCRRSRSKESVRPRSDGCSTHSEGRLCQHRWLLHEIEGTRLKKHGQLSLEKATPYSNLGMLCSNLGMLSPFAGMLCEDEDGIREESRDPRAVLPVPARSWKQRRRRGERPSLHKATLRVHLGTPSMRFETPDEERTKPTVKLGSPCRHPQSLHSCRRSSRSLRRRGWLRYTRGLLCVRRPAPGPRPASQRPRT